VRRYERDRPGELIHVDVKKIAAIPAGGGWRLHGRGNDGTHGHSGAGYRYLHTALDDRSRLVYSETHDDELAVTAAAFWARAAAFFTAAGLGCDEVLTDNGSCYRSRLWAQACAATGTKHRRTRPRHPQTNGKVERFHRTLLEEWAYIRPWTSEPQRQAGYANFIHFDNHHRPHGALGWATPAITAGDNLPGEHI
jgi:transposase InsO family protein